MNMIVYAQQNIRSREGAITERKYFKLNLSGHQVGRLNNGALISCGLTFYGGSYPGAPDELSPRVLSRLDRREIPETEYKHSGCQSRCTLRGDATCGW